jgi:hypothetical protein
MNGKQKRLDKRRLDFYQLRAQGRSLREVVDVISEAYNAPKTALYKDWERRHTWGDYVIPESEHRFLVQDTLYRLNELRREYWLIVKDEATDSKTRIRVLGKLANMEFAILKALQSLGLVHRQPAKMPTDKVETNNLTRLLLRLRDRQSDARECFDDPTDVIDKKWHK